MMIVCCIGILAKRAKFTSFAEKNNLLFYFKKSAIYLFIYLMGTCACFKFNDNKPKTGVKARQKAAEAKHVKKIRVCAVHIA